MSLVATKDTHIKNNAMIKAKERLSSFLNEQRTKFSLSLKKPLLKNKIIISVIIKFLLSCITKNG